MIKTTMQTLALAATLVLAPAAQAALVQVDFQVTIDTAGALQGQVFAGRFSYDDADFTPLLGDELSPLLDFDFSFAGQQYGLADLFYGDAVRTGGQFGGLDAAAAPFSFLPAIAGFAPSFGFDLGNGVSGNGSFTWQLREAQVSEPASAALAAMGLLALALRRRRH